MQIKIIDMTTDRAIHSPLDTGLLPGDAWPRMCRDVSEFYECWIDEVDLIETIHGDRITVRGVEVARLETIYAGRR
jgi:hypothetical protein